MLANFRLRVGSKISDYHSLKSLAFAAVSLRLKVYEYWIAEPGSSSVRTLNSVTISKLAAAPFDSEGHIWILGVRSLDGGRVGEHHLDL
jgi:hypothetical protein